MYLLRNQLGFMVNVFIIMILVINVINKFYDPIILV